MIIMCDLYRALLPGMPRSPRARIRDQPDPALRTNTHYNLTGNNP